MKKLHDWNLSYSQAGELQTQFVTKLVLLCEAREKSL